MKLTNNLISFLLSLHLKSFEPIDIINYFYIDTLNESLKTEISKEILSEYDFIMDEVDEDESDDMMETYNKLKKILKTI